MKESTRDVGGMRVEMFLPLEHIPENAVVIPKLPHGTNIVTIESGNEDLSDCDAIITQNRSISIGIQTADCAPVCFGDGNTTGIAHIGWRGLCAGLIEKMLPHFDTATLGVYVAPFLHSFEIQKDFCYEQIMSKFGGIYLEEKDNVVVFNFKEAINSLLPPQTMYDERSTTDPAFPSYRRDKTTDRLVTIVSFR